MTSCQSLSKNGTMMNMPPLFNRQKGRAKYFGGLPYEAQLEAGRLYRRMLEKWGRDLPGWRRAILIGQTKRWAMISEEERSRWGHSMLAKRGGYAVQERYRMEGRTGPKHPAHKAAAKRVTKRRWSKLQRDNVAFPSHKYGLENHAVMQCTVRRVQPPKLRPRLLPIG
jgi:hypothetical protein